MGPSNEDKDQSKAIRERELATSREYLDYAKQSRKESRELLKPAIDIYGKRASGDPEQVMSGISTIVGEQDAQYKAARENIERSLPPGPAKNSAIAKLERERAGASGRLIVSSIDTAIDKLANIGSGIGSFALNEAGAGIRSVEGAAQTQSAILQTEAQGKAATMGFLGDLAGAGGSIVGGLVGGGKSGG